MSWSSTTTRKKETWRLTATMWSLPWPTSTPTTEGSSIIFGSTLSSASRNTTSPKFSKQSSPASATSSPHTKGPSPTESNTSSTSSSPASRYLLPNLAKPCLQRSKTRHIDVLRRALPTVRRYLLPLFEESHGHHSAFDRGSVPYRRCELR